MFLCIQTTWQCVHWERLDNIMCAIGLKRHKLTEVLITVYYCSCHYFLCAGQPCWMLGWCQVKFLWFQNSTSGGVQVEFCYWQLGNSNLQIQVESIVRSSFSESYVRRLGTFSPSRALHTQCQSLMKNTAQSSVLVSELAAWVQLMPVKTCLMKRSS